MKNCLTHLNTILGDDYPSSELIGKTYPSIFIIGAPRSGTTLLNQLMVNHLEMGYVSNLMAAFWSTPVLGACISEKLISEHDLKYSDTSHYGRTEGIAQPHEFGMFWRSQLGYSDMIQKPFPVGDGKLLEIYSVLENISRVFKKPVLYKVFQLYWHLVEFDRVSRDSKWIHIERSEIENSQSVLNLMRKRKSNDEKSTTWQSAVPILAIERKPCNEYEMALMQVRYINKWIKSQLLEVESSRQLHVKLENLVENPTDVIECLAKFANVEKKYNGYSEIKINKKTTDLGSKNDLEGFLNAIKAVDFAWG